MPIGNVSNNLVPVQGSSWEDLLGIDLDTTTNATRANFAAMLVENDKVKFVEAWYTGSGALTTSEFASFPKGSIIHAVGLSAPAIYYKVAAAGTDTWKYQAVNT